VTVATLRAQFGIVFQESILFDASIRENIRLGRPDATDAEVESAARQAEIHDFILTLPEGYDTRVGERGGRLSGGQRQRVAIARALVRQPSVLILDEATSALDPQTESSINETLRRLTRNHTVLSVTHRLAPVAHSDRVFVLERGKIVEEDTHDALLAKGGVYAKLWAKQHGFTVSADGAHAQITAERLGAVPIFASLDPELLAELASQMTSDSRDAGTLLIREGDPGNEFFVVAHGRLEVLKRTPDGHQQRVQVVDDGDYFGEIALIKDVPRTATVRSLTKVTYLTLNREHFLRLVDRVPRMREQIEEAIATRLERTRQASGAPPGWPTSASTPAAQP
jgi:ATP-binding cassette subfamily B protein